MGIIPFNSVAGFSVGKGTANVILANGDITTNNITITNKTILSNINNVAIAGGIAGQFIQTDGSGNLTFATVNSSAISNGSSNVQVYPNGNIATSVSGVPNIFVVSNTAIRSNVNIITTGNLTAANASLGNIVTANFLSGILTTNSQPNITSLGSLNTLTVVGNANVLNLAATQVLATSNITTPQIIANAAQGIAPFIVNSTTKVENLNADLLDGYGTTTSNTASTVAIRDFNGNLSANYFTGDGSSLTGITFNGLTDSNTANLTINEIAYQGTTRLLVGHAGTTGYTFSQYDDLNPNIYITSGTTIALDLTSSGHPFLVQYANGANCDIGLTHVSTTGVSSVGSAAQAKVSGTLYWQIPINFVGNFKYQCFNHPAMSGNFVIADSNFSNGMSSYTGNFSASNIDVTNAITSSNITTNNAITANVLNLKNLGPQLGTNPGDVTWNNISETYELLMNDGVYQSIGQEQYTLIKANVAITLGQIVAFSGVSVGRLLGEPANAQKPNFISSYVIGVAAQNIAVGDTGYITSFGQLSNVNTNSFNEGDILYLDPNVPGGFTNVLPNAPNPKVQIATVLNKSLSAGSIQIRVVGFPKIDQLRDVSTTTPLDGQYFKYTTSGNYWTAGNIAISQDTTPTLGANLNAANYSITSINNISANSANFSGAIYSNAPISNASQLATKAYVDSASSTGISIHTPVLVGTSSTLTATYTTGGTTPTIIAIATNVLTTSTTHGLSVNDVIVFGSTTNGLVAGVPYFVYSTPAINQITLSNAFNGIQITSLTDGTGLNVTSRANAGVNSRLTNSGVQAALVIGGVSMSLGNRVLVLGQTNSFENGVYTVTIVGSPTTNWELTRAPDQNKYIPSSTSGLSSGSYFYIQSGTRTGESYVLSTTGTIIIGTTNLAYTLFSASPQFTSTSPVTIVGQTIGLANLTGTGDFVVLANSPTLRTPNIGAAIGTSLNVSTGNINAGNLILTGIASITSNVTAGNLSVTSGNVNANIYLGNRISISGNIDGGNFNPSGNLVVSGNASAGNISTTGTLNVTGNVTAGNINSVRGVFTGNINASNAIVTGQLISTLSTGTPPFVVNSTTKVANLSVETANTALYVNVAPVTSNISYPTFVYANILGNYPLQSNTAFSANLANGAFIAKTYVGNLIGSYANGNSNVNIVTASGNVTIAATGNTTMVITGTGANIIGTANVSGNANVGNLGASQLVATANITTPQLISNVVTGTAPIIVSSTTQVANLNVANAGFATNAGTAATAVTVTSNSQPNITTVGTLVNLNVNGNATVGNILTDNIRYANGIPYVFVSNPSGTNTQIQFNDANAFAGSSSLTFNKTTNTLTTTRLVATANANLGNAVTANFFVGDGGLLSNITIAAGTTLFNGASNVVVLLDGNVITAINGTPNVQVISSNGVTINGNLSVTGVANIGSVKYNTLTVNADTNITTAATIYFANGPITLTLPDAALNIGASFYIKNTNNQFVTIQGINTINGKENLVLRYLNSAINVISNGTNWDIF